MTISCGFRRNRSDCHVWRLIGGASLALRMMFQLDRGTRGAAEVVMARSGYGGGVWRYLVVVAPFLPTVVRGQGVPLSDLEALCHIASYGDLIQAFAMDSAKDRAH